AAHARNQLRKGCQQLGVKIGRGVAAARGVAAGVCKTGRESRPDRVGDAQEDDWNCRSRASDSESGGRRPSNNDIDVAVQNLGDEAGFLCERALRPAYVNGQILPFGPAAWSASRKALSIAGSGDTAPITATRQTLPV